MSTENAKKNASYAAVDQNLDPSHQVVGIGSGTTIVYVVDRLAQLDTERRLVCVPTSFQARELILSHGLHLGRVDEYVDIDIAFDGADEIDSDLNLIKGGGACMFLEKLVASCARKFIVVADHRKSSVALSRGVPLEVVSVAHRRLFLELERLGGHPRLRDAGDRKAGPVVTDHGNLVVDCEFGEIRPERVAELDVKIKALVGVVETGIFPGMAHKAYIGLEDGTVRVQKRRAAL
ncbi:hypothetical protein KL907_003126 [Ogataea polymorpha]|nr:hypothetical protein KL907_003126 [Ogataea polymorpha]